MFPLLADGEGSTERMGQEGNERDVSRQQQRENGFTHLFTLFLFLFQGALEHLRRFV